MAHGYHALQHWNQWLIHEYLGKRLVDAETNLLSKMLTKHFGKHALLIGVSHQKDLLQATGLPCHTLLSPLGSHSTDSLFIESDLHELPIFSGSIDLVFLPHTMEFLDNPRQLLAEACRIVKPEGLIVITGFNPYSIWGAKKLFTKHKSGPWLANFIAFREVIRWLKLADFEMEAQRTLLFRPPLAKEKSFNQLKFLEKIGNAFFPILGGVYVLIARAKVIPLTPIKMRWKQQLSGIRVSTSLPGHVRMQPIQTSDLSNGLQSRHVRDPGVHIDEACLYLYRWCMSW